MEITQVRLDYSFYGQSNDKIAVKVVNKENGEVIREIPSEEMQSLETQNDTMVDKIFSRKV